MARARNIKPGFYTNDILAEVEPLGRILFTGLWTIADREGRLEDRPRRIKAEILPYDDADADDLLNQLAEKGFVLRYSVGDARYIQVLNFNKHQNPHMKESASEIPAPDLTGASTVQEPKLHGENPADSLNPHPDSLNRIPDTENARATDTTKATDDVKATRFAEFWDAYPKKVGKGAAAKAFKNIKWREIEFAALMAALEKQKKSEQWQDEGGRFVPNPATWLNQERWGDELPSTRAAPKHSQPVNQAAVLREQAQRERAEYEQARSDRDSGGIEFRLASSSDHTRAPASLSVDARRRTG